MSRSVSAKKPIIRNNQRRVCLNDCRPLGGDFTQAAKRTWIVVPPIGFDAPQIATTDLFEESFAILLSSPRYVAVQFN
jgi:hypothetical protein